MNGDIHMTVTVDAGGAPVFVTDPRTGTTTISTIGTVPRVSGLTVQEQTGRDAQEHAGQGSRGKNGRVT